MTVLHKTFQSDKEMNFFISQNKDISIINIETVITRRRLGAFTEPRDIESFRIWYTSNNKTNE